MSVVEVIAEVVDRGPWLRQLGDVGGDAPGVVAGEEVRRRAASRLLLEIDVGQRLPVGVGATRCGWAYRHILEAAERRKTMRVGS